MRAVVWAGTSGHLQAHCVMVQHSTQACLAPLCLSIRFIQLISPYSWDSSAVISEQHALSSPPNQFNTSTELLSAEPPMRWDGQCDIGFVIEILSLIHLSVQWKQQTERQTNRSLRGHCALLDMIYGGALENPALTYLSIHCRRMKGAWLSLKEEKENG